MNWKYLFATGLGSVIEYYDIAIYGLMASVLTQHFYPPGQLSLVWFYLGYFAGYPVRPLGGLLFSHLGDRYGRKVTFATSILLMGFATAAIGCIPSFGNIGYWAIIALVICRILQGIALGGEYSGMTVYLYEHAEPKRRRLIGSLAPASSLLGLLLGTIIFYFLSEHLTIANLWRLPFLLSLVLSLIALRVRLILTETPMFVAEQSAGRLHASPLKVLFRDHLRPLVGWTLINCLVSVAYTIFFVFMPTYWHDHFAIPLNTGNLANAISLLVMTAAMPLFSLIFAKRSATALLRWGIIGVIILPLLVCKAYYSSHVGILVCAQLMVGLVISIYGMTSPSFYPSLFPTAVRYSGVGLIYNISNGLAAMSPMLVAYWYAKTHQVWVPIYFCVGLAVMTLMLFEFVMCSPLPSHPPQAGEGEAAF
jgi:MHS family proline/betaine transporter-like MFS transporter